MERKHVSNYDLFKIIEGKENPSFLYDDEKEPMIKLPDPKEPDIDEALDIKATVSEIINILKKRGTEIKEKIIKQIYLLISNDSVVEEAIMNFMTSIGIPEKYGVFLTEEVLKYENSGEFAKYIEKRDVSMKLLIGKKLNLVEIFSAKGINKQFLEFLVTYRWSSTPALGPAEVALSVLIDKARRPSSKESGDLRVADKPIEIKGTGGRLRGQKGFGDGQAFKKNISSAFEALAKQYKLKKFDAHTDISGADDGFWNFTGNNWGAEKVGMALIEAGAKVKPAEIAACIASGIKGILQKSQEAQIAKRLTPYIKKTGEIDREGLIREYALISFEYYCSQEDFEYMVLADDKGNIFTFNINDFDTYLGKSIAVSPPNYGDKGGAQGVVFSIKMK